MKDLIINNTELESMVNQMPGLSNQEVQNIQETLCKIPLEGTKTLRRYEPVTDHYFHAGMYCRKVFRIAGAIVVGKVHKKDHFYVCVSGKLIVWDENGARLLNSGDIIQSKAGTKRVVYAVTDAIGMTMHIVDAKTVEEAEKELVEDDEMSMYGPGNKLKTPSLEEIMFTAELAKE